MRRAASQPPFPTRRSSDLGNGHRGAEEAIEALQGLEGDRPGRHDLGEQRRVDRQDHRGCDGESRSEEHTSEIQSPCNIVCRLLLEKKMKPAELRYVEWTDH